MLTYKPTILSASVPACDITFNNVTSTGKKVEAEVDITGTQGELYFIVDAKDALSDLTLVVLGGSNPAAVADKTFTIPQKGCKAITVSGGACMQADGKVRFTLASTSAFNSQSVRMVVLGRRNVESR